MQVWEGARSMQVWEGGKEAGWAQVGKGRLLPKGAPLGAPMWEGRAGKDQERLPNGHMHLLPRTVHQV